jgi:secondary thiamine-phosphate synthase enzyme
MTIGAAQPRRDHDQWHVPTEKLGKRMGLRSPRVFARPTADHQRISCAPIGKLGGLGWTVHVADLASELGSRPTSEKGYAILYGRAMRNVAKILKLRTHRQGLQEITDEVRAWVGHQKVTTGLLTLFCRHTSASLLIQENAAREVRADLETFFETLAPEDPGRYQHDDEGPDDMPAHLRTALTDVHLSIPVVDGQLALGTWQGIYLFEHRKRPHDREVALHLSGD